MREQRILNDLQQKKIRGEKSLALLIDPDKIEIDQVKAVVAEAQACGVDYLFVGGSLIVGYNFSEIVSALKTQSDLPLIIFPGNNLHIDYDADAILLLSLISGRNADLLIGQHVVAAPILKKSNLEILSTGYMLIESGRQTTVSYISNSMPIPADKTEIAICTAMAGEMLGMSLIYMDGGSGAQIPISARMISGVSRNIQSPLLIGGGIDSGLKAQQAFDAGADIVVVGNGFEKDPKILNTIGMVKNEFNKVLYPS